MVRCEVEVRKQVENLMVLMEAECKKLPMDEWQNQSRESLLMFKHLEQFPLIVKQQQFEVRWEQTDTLYTFPDSLVVYIVDQDIFIQWSLEALPSDPQASKGHDSMSLVPFHTLMLSYTPVCHAETSARITSPRPSGKMVFSAVMVFVHPWQHLISITVLSSRMSPALCSILCHLPEKGVGKFYPCMPHGAHLILSVADSKEGPILDLNMPIRASGDFVVHSLHRWIHPVGHVAVLPLAFNPDVGLSNIYLIEASGCLWTNKEFTAPTSPSGTSTSEHPAMTMITTNSLEANTSVSLVSLTDDNFVQYWLEDPIPSNGNNEETPHKATSKKETPKKTPKKKSSFDEDELNSSSSLESLDSGTEGNNSAMKAEFGHFEGSSSAEESNKNQGGEELDEDLDTEMLGCHNSGMGLGSNGSETKFTGIVSSGQVMVNMMAYNKVTGSGTTMAWLEKLGDDIIELTQVLNWKMAKIALTLFDKIKAGFSGTSGMTKEFITDMLKLATDFFMDTWEFEA